MLGWYIMVTNEQFYSKGEKMDLEVKLVLVEYHVYCFAWHFKRCFHIAMVMCGATATLEF